MHQHFFTFTIITENTFDIYYIPLLLKQLLLNIIVTSSCNSRSSQRQKQLKCRNIRTTEVQQVTSPSLKILKWLCSYNFPRSFPGYQAETLVVNLLIHISTTTFYHRYLGLKGSLYPTDSSFRSLYLGY